MFFSRTNKGETSTLTVFIESGAVRMGIVLRIPDQLPTLVYETARSFKTGDSPEQLVSRMLAALTEACADVTKEALPHIISRRVAKGAFDSVKFIYGAPWYLSRGRRITIESEKPTAYSAKTLDALIEEHSADIIPELHKDAVRIERFATGWSVNGYNVADPTGKEGTRLSLNLFASAIPAGVKSTVEETVARSFHAHATSHHSIALVASTTLAASDENNGSLLFIHISDTMTELALVSDDAILDSITFPEGTAHLHETWSKKSRRPVHEAALRAQQTPGDIGMTDSWQAGIGECLGALITERGMPERIVVLGDSTIQQQALEAVQDISMKIFNQVVTALALTESSFGSSIRVAAGAAPGSPAMRLLTLVE